MYERKDQQLGEHDKKILKALYAIHPEGCGYNQLRFRSKVNKKVLDLRLLTYRNQSLVFKKLVNVERGRTKNSRWKITLTENGKRAYFREIGVTKKEAFELVTDLPEEKMREVLQNIMSHVFISMFNVERGHRLESHRKLELFLRAIAYSCMDVVNEQLGNVGLKDRVFPYHQVIFSLDRIHWWWIRDDALLAIEKGHWLSPGRIQLLKTLGTHSEQFLLEHNRKWQTRLKNKAKEQNRETDDMLILEGQQKELEYKEREPLITEKHPEAFTIDSRTEWFKLKSF